MYSKSPSIPSARTNASQKVVSRKHCACTCRERLSRRSLGYPPSIALLMASWIVIVALLHHPPSSHFETRHPEMRDVAESPAPGGNGDLRQTERQQMSLCEAAFLCREMLQRSCMILCCRHYIASTVPRSGIGVRGHFSPWHVGHERQEVRPPSRTASAPCIEPPVSPPVA